MRPGNLAEGESRGQPAHGLRELRQRERLPKHGVHGCGALRVDLEAAREERDPLVAEVFEDSEAVAGSYMHVEEDHVDGLRTKQVLSNLDRRRLENAVALELEVHSAEHPQAF